MKSKEEKIEQVKLELIDVTEERPLGFMIGYFVDDGFRCRSINLINLKDAEACYASMTMHAFTQRKILKNGQEKFSE